MQLGWHTAAIVALGLMCGLAASVVTVWLVTRLVRRAFASAAFRADLQAALLASSAIQGRLESAVREQLRKQGERPIGGLVPPETRDAAVARVHDWLRGPAAERVLREGIRSGLQAIARSDVPLGRFVTWDVSPLIAAAVDRAMPLVIVQLGAALRERENQIRLHVALRGMVDRFLAEQDGWKRAIGNFLLTDRALAYLVTTISTTGVEALGATLHDPQTRQRIVEALRQSIERALEHPLPVLLGGLAPERVEALSEDWSARALAAVREPSADARITALLQNGAARVEAVPLGRLAGAQTAADLDRVATQLAGRAVAALRSRTASVPPVGEVIVRAIRFDLLRAVIVAALAAGALAWAASLFFTLS